MKPRVILIIVFSLLSFCIMAQRGKIIKPATTTVMDPNQDGFVSKSNQGFLFPTDKGFQGYYVKRFEIPMFGIPIAGNGEVASDNQAGQACGTTDITVDSLGFGAYAVIDNADNLIFRFRIGTDKPSVEAYTILIDTDGKIGADDPNATTNNPGFEIDITLIKNQNKGVYIYNINGIESCPNPLRNYSYDSHFQISIGDIITCNDPDYFYDFYVPLSDLTSLFGITKNTELRFVAVTNVSATCAMAGKISDVGGVDDDLYNGCNPCAFLDLVNNQCPTSLNNLCGTCAGFQSGVTPKPVINTPVKAGENTVTGTSVPGAQVFINLFTSANVLKESVTVNAANSNCTACPWTATFSNPLQLGDIISARAKSTTGCSSGGVSSDATVAIVVNNIPPVLAGASGALTYTENDAPLRIDPTLSATDADDINLDLATIAIITNFNSAQDILSFTPVAGVTGNYNSTTGVLSFSGVTSKANYQTLLRSVAYSNSSENPSTLPRTIRFQVNDGLDNSNFYTRQINIVNVNDAPVAINDSGTTNEDTALTLPNVTANDTDVDGTIDVTTVDLDPLTAGRQVTFTNTQGTWSVSNAGAVTFTPASNFNGTATKTYTVNDNQGAISNAATITITVAPINDNPVANNDSGTTIEDSSISINVTSNDSDLDGTINTATVDLDPVTAGQQTSFTNQGTWTVATTGVVTYTPALNFNGVVSITYNVRDNSGGLSNTATITITVTAVNDPPVAINDNGTTNEDTPVTLPNITANDTDIDGTVVASTVDLDPLTGGQQTTFTNAQGTWTIAGTGAVTFTPAGNFNGTATRTYTVNDNLGATSNTAIITITINAINDAPVATNDFGSTNEDNSVTLSNITSNDTDVDGTISISTIDLDVVTGGQQTSATDPQGTWSINTSTGQLTFTPASNYVGSATRNYAVRDNLGLLSNAATITITVNPINDPPVAIHDSGTTNEDSPVVLPNIASNDTDVDGTISIASIDLDVTTGGQQTTLADSQGTWSINTGTGALTFTPVLNYNGTATRNYTLNDNLGATSNAGLISITVTPVNDPPVAINISGNTFINTPLTFTNISSTASDVDNAINPASVDLNTSSLGIQNTITTSDGTWVVNGSSDVTFTPLPAFTGNASITYTINDAAGLTSNNASLTVTVSGTVIPGNNNPVANDDSGTTNEDVPLTITNLIANDTDADGNGTINVGSVDLDPLANGQQTSITTTEGTWTVNGSAALTFTPTLNFNGTATRTYIVRDNPGAPSNTATITITVNPVDDNPVAVNDSGITNEDTAVQLTDITANDTDAEGNSTIVKNTLDLNPSAPGQQTTTTNGSGTWTVNTTSGELSFTPATNFSGTATVNYTVNDNTGRTSNTATISIIVNPLNDAPITNDDAATTNEDTAVTLPDITLNDVDSDGTFDKTTLDIDLSQAGIQTTFTTSQGSWSVNPTSGQVTFTPALNFNGIVTISYVVKDNSGALSDAATITVTVVAVNDNPVAQNVNGSTPEDTPIILSTIATTATDIDGTVDAATIDLNTTVAGIQNSVTNSFGTWSANAQGDVTFQPLLNFTGTASINYSVNDNNGGTSNSASITIVVNPINDPPQVTDDNATTPEETAISINILSNDTDVDGTMDLTSTDIDPATAGIQKTFSDAKGSWTVDAAGMVSFTPASNYNGLAIASYTIADNNGALSSSAKITITVSPVNDNPVANADNAQTDEDTAIVLTNIMDNDTDIDGTLDIGKADLEPGTAGIQNTVTNSFGIWSVNSTGSLTFTPALNFNGTATINYITQDNDGGVSNSATITIVVNPINDAPVLKNISISTDRDIAVNGNAFDATDADPEGTTLILNTTPTNAPDNGTLTLAADGQFTYAPKAGYTGSDLVEIKICDQGLPLPAVCATKVINIEVKPVNRPPIIIVNGAPGNSLTATTNEDTLLLLCFESVDPDGDEVYLNTISNISGGGKMTVFNNVRFCFEFIPALNFFGTSVWEVEVCDRGVPSLCGKLTIFIIVTPVNDAPLAVTDTVRVLRKVLFKGNVLTNDTDVENDKLSLDPTPVTDVTNGKSTLNSDGSFTYISDLTFRGTDSLRYKVCDNGVPNGCSEGKLIIIVEDLPLRVYQAISPNGDGNNDYLRIDGIDYYTENQVMIFDRFNNLVFEISGYNNEDKIWTGQANRGIGNSVLPEGTYFYSINLGDGSAMLKGYLVLRRN